MMSKKWMAALLALAMTLMMSSTAFAGWEQYQSGEWAYRYGNGSYAADTWIGNYYVGPDGCMVVNNYTPDGYWVGASGAYESWWGRRSDYAEPYTGGAYNGNPYSYVFNVDIYGDGVEHWSMEEYAYGSRIGQYELYPMGGFCYVMMDIYSGTTLGYVSVSPDRRTVYVSCAGQTNAAVY